MSSPPAGSNNNSCNGQALSECVGRGDWFEVMIQYMRHPEVTIPKSGDTAIHAAIDDGQEAVAEYLVQYCPEDVINKVLAIGNKDGDTPLHAAAKLGSVRMCQCIAKKDSNLIGSRNVKGETPLFVAVSHGKRDALLCLLDICKEKQHQYYAYYRRNNGDTILHSAISQQHFDITFYIIHEYERELVNKVNENGMSPLHLLASNPSCFPSGTHLSGLPKLFYHCLSVSKFQRPTDDVRSSTSNWLSTYLPSWRNFITNRLLQGIMRKENHQRDVERANNQGYRYAQYYASLIDLKKRCIWSLQVMNELDFSSDYENEQRGMYPGETTTITLYKDFGDIDDDFCPNITKGLARATQMETPLLIAAKNGVTEMVDRILTDRPGAIMDMNNEKKNIVMLAVENRQLPMYKLLVEDSTIRKNIFGHVDKEGNSVLHIAARLGDDQKPWLIRGSALQMHMEVKWYNFVKNSMPPGFFVRYNNDFQTPGEIFKLTHKELKEEGQQSLANTSKSCSVVAALIATVGFATSTTVPGGVKQDSGSPTLENKPIFIISAAASLIALCSSIISVIMFLGILTSSLKQKDFYKDLPCKLLLGLISLLVSIVSMFVSFFAGHYFVLKDDLKHSAILVYALVCFPLVVFIIATFPLDSQLVWTTFTNEPLQRKLRSK